MDNKSTEEIMLELEGALKALQDVCIKNKMPMFVSIATENVLPVKSINKSLSPTELGVKLSDDRIMKYIGSCNKHLALVYVNEDGISNKTESDIIDELLEEM